MTATAPPRRRIYIDWARGVAVLLMIEAHTTDAWTSAAAKSAYAFRNATIVGGFAAPLFLWLAGVAVALSAARIVQRTGSRAEAADAGIRRGLEIFVLAFAFRLQAFVVSPGSHPVTLFRVDILNVMGLAIALSAILWACAARRAARVAIFAGAATIAAMATPIVRASSLVDALPIWLQWYVRPAGEHTTFTLLPWIGFVFAGGAVGALVAEAGDDVSERRLQTAFGIAGLALVAAGFYTATLPTIYRSSSFWTSSPTWFAIRVGVLMTALSLMWRLAAWAQRSEVRIAPLERLGRSSLFVYWIHVELVYGYATWSIHGRLPLWATLTAAAAFSALMYGAVVIRDGLVERRRSRRKADRAPQVAPA